MTEEFPQITHRAGQTQRHYRRGETAVIVTVAEQRRYLPARPGERSRWYRVTMQITSGSPSRHARLAKQIAAELELPDTAGAQLYRFYRTKEGRPESSYAFTHGLSRVAGVRS